MFANPLVMAVLIFVVTYLCIISEKINRTAISLLGAVMLLLVNVVNQEEAIHHVDFNTIGLLIGMMIIVTITKRTGVFQYIAIKAAKHSKGDPWKIILTFSIITAVASAFLDNVTTILLIVPIALVIADTLEMNPIPFLVPLILAANIGGTATLIGDPPNIMIGSATGLGFMDFILNLTPIIIIIFIVVLFCLKLIYRKSLNVSDVQKNKIMELDESLAIEDFSLLKKSAAVLLLTVLGFIFHQTLGYESATVALFGAALLLLISKIEPEEVLLEIEWPTIFFFMALFVLVGGLEEVGVIKLMAEKVLAITHGNETFTIMLVLWASAIISSFLDNIPFVATMIPLIKSIAVMSGMDVMPLWWALSLGACLGGNGTLVGASANVIVSGILEKHGHKLGFVEYMKVGFPIMLLTIAISSVYLLLFYV